MNKLKLLVLGLVCIAVLASCQSSEQLAQPDAVSPAPTPSATVSASPETSAEPVEVTATPDNPQDLPRSAVTIRLKDEPRLLAGGEHMQNVRTLVSKEPQTFIFAFAEPMNRQSVEQTLSALGKLPKEAAFASSVQYAWQSDTQLQATVKTDITYGQPSVQLLGYELNLKGALTKAGKPLAEVPVFSALVSRPSQLSRLSTDGQLHESVASFEIPYFFRPVPGDPSYVFALRSSYYCECDAAAPWTYDLYNVNSRELVSYPFQLYSSYQGEGDFVADTRGFFYSNPKGLQAPASETAHRIKVESYVLGSAISKDRQSAIMVLGDKDQKDNLDLAIYRFKDGILTVKNGAVKGAPLINQLDGGLAPIEFHDDGKTVEFTTEKPDQVNVIHLKWSYDWHTDSITAWKPPIPNISGFYTGSSDGVYRLYDAHLLYKDNALKKQLSMEDGLTQFVNGTHQIISITRNPSDSQSTSLLLYDADSGKTSVLSANWKGSASLISTSADGKWIYYSQ